MKGNSSYKDLSNKFPVLNKLVSFRSFCLVLALIFISLGVVGGCSNNDNGNGEPDVVTLGAHRDVALEDIGDLVDLAPHTGEVNNIILDGTSLVTLTQEEIGLIREAYDKGFILFVYEATDKDIVRIYRNIIGHPFRHAELESLDGIPEGNMHALFTLEQHEGLDWSGTAQFTESATLVLLEGEEDDLVPSDPQGAFSTHGFHISEWLDAQVARRQELLAEGLITFSAVELMDKLDVKDEFDEQLEAVTRDSDGTLLDLASANIHTDTKYIAFTTTTDKDSFQMTSKAWIVTADTDTGVFSFLLVDQDFNLATANGFTIDSDKIKGSYLNKYQVKNTYSVNGTTLTSTDAFLLEESPATVQATTSSATTSLSQSISGTVGAINDGVVATVTGGVSWSTSTTVTKADVAIENLSTSDSDFNNDATWKFLPRSAEILDDSCDNSIHNLADLAHTTFQPATAFIVRISGDYADQTLTLDTEFTIQLRTTFIGNCNVVGCDCDAQHADSLDPYLTTTTQSIPIPAAP